MTDALVVVASPGPDPVASACLAAEGVAHDVAVLEGDAAYAGLLARLWQRGRDFVLVEHDVCPPVGSVEALLACGRDWCGHDYPLGAPHGRRVLRGHHPGLGLVRLRGTLSRSWPDAWRRWEGRPWHQLDAAVALTMRRAGHGDWYHVHEPPAAHAKHHAAGWRRALR